jgi:thioredoxin-related protein
MAKKDKKKEIAELEEVEEEFNDFEEFDDEDEVDVKTVKIKKKETVKPAKEVYVKDSKVKAPHECQLMKWLPIATFVLSLITFILVIVILCKVNNLDGTTTKKKATGTDNGNGTEQTDSEYDTSMFTEITYEEFVKMIQDKNKTYFVYTGRPTCSYCRMMIGNYQKSVEEYNYTLYYFDTDYVTSDMVNTIQSYDEVFQEDFPATPMVYKVGNYGVEAVAEGYTEYDTYASFLEENGVKKK